jgi:5-methylcytosine-specific restriction endonuclease McrA
MEWQYKEYIKRWKEGKEDGIVSKIDISGHIRRYFFEKYKASCSKCGWNKESIYTGKCPLHLNHIDGDSSNNKEDNLELLCPNCHSLTSNFGILNKGNGRYNRLNIKHPKYR